MGRKRVLARIRTLQQNSEVLEWTSAIRQPCPEPTSALNLAAAARHEGRGITAPSLRGLQQQVGNRLLQRLAKEDAFVVSSRIERTLAEERGQGEPLDTQVRRPMQAALGQDLDQVRIHTDDIAGQLASSLSARAFTQGRDVYFAAGEYAPHTSAGQRVLAHELVHVLQQRPGAKLVVGSTYDPAEQEADAVAERVVGSFAMGHARDAQAIRRQPIEEETAQTLRRQEEDEQEIGLIRRVDEEEEELTAQAPTTTTEAPTTSAETPTTEQAPTKSTETPITEQEGISEVERPTAEQAPTTSAERPTTEQAPTAEAEAPATAAQAPPTAATQAEARAGPLGSLWNSAVVVPIRDAGEALGGSGPVRSRAQRAAELIVRSREAIDGLFENYRDQPDTFGRLTYSRERMNTIVAALLPYYSEREPVSDLSSMLGDLVPWLEGLGQRL